MSMVGTNINTIVDLKFALEREIADHNDMYLKIHTTHKPVAGENFKDYICLIDKFRVNLCIYGVKYIEKQKELLYEINEKLKILCNHTWVETTIEDGLAEGDIIYCNKCFCRKEKRNN